MGLFSYKSYYKPGKGIEKDAPEKNAFFRFFEIYGRKFWRFIEVNAIYLLILLPILLTVYAETYDTLYSVFSSRGYTGTSAYYTDGNLTVTAIEPGASGNDFTLDIDADKQGTYTVTLYTDRGAAAKDASETKDYWFVLEGVSTVEDLAAYENEYVTFSGSGPLRTIHEAHLQGGDGLMSTFTPLLYLAMLYFAHVPAPIRWLLLILSVLAYGPTKCGVTYVLRNYSRQSHSWISDIWDKAKENWKYGVLFGVIDCAIAVLVIFNLTYHPDASMASLIRITKYLTLLVAFLYVFMRKYIYLMIVTVNLNLRSLIQNAWLLVFIGIFRNFFSGLANLIIWIGAYLLIMAVHPFFEILFLGLLIYSFTNFLSISACYPLIDKYLVQPIKEMQDAAAAQEPAEPGSDNPEG
ncbi:MAG: hypothetical protein IJ206_02495 [Oscillospiraceae bacterium]|nr:hypothetical protein [Oscillospiraceae bacterium]